MYRLQKHCTCPTVNPLCGNAHWKTVFAGSRFTTPAESHYVPIEGEALALLYAFDSCKMFIMGCPNLLVAVDHKPLIRLFNNRDLNEITNPRLLKIREKTLMYSFRVVSIPGIRDGGADTMSRLPFITSDNPVDKYQNIEPTITGSINLQMGQAISTGSIVAESSTDPVYQELFHMIETGFPNHKDQLPGYLREYWNFHNELYSCQGLVYLEGRMLIPTNLHRQMLDELHIGHQGVNCMKANAQQRFFWPRGRRSKIPATNANAATRWPRRTDPMHQKRSDHRHIHFNAL